MTAHALKVAEAEKHAVMDWQNAGCHSQCRLAQVRSWRKGTEAISQDGPLKALKASLALPVKFLLEPVSSNSWLANIARA